VIKYRWSKPDENGISCVEEIEGSEEEMTIGKLLEYLDGAGLIIVDDDLIKEELDKEGFSLDTIIRTESEEN
jgi:hypothetical protein